MKLLEQNIQQIGFALSVNILLILITLQLCHVSRWVCQLVFILHINSIFALFLSSQLYSCTHRGKLRGKPPYQTSERAMKRPFDKSHF